MQIAPDTLPLTTIIGHVNAALIRHRGPPEVLSVLLRPETYGELAESAGGSPTQPYIDATLDSGTVRFYPNPTVGIFPPDTVLCMPTAQKTIALRIVQQREYSEQILVFSEAVEFDTNTSVSDFTDWCGDGRRMNIEVYDGIPFAVFETSDARIDFMMRWNAPKT